LQAPIVGIVIDNQFSGVIPENGMIDPHPEVPIPEKEHQKLLPMQDGQTPLPIKWALWQPNSREILITALV
jgi:hypothetical protein